MLNLLKKFFGKQELYRLSEILTVGNLQIFNVKKGDVLAIKIKDRIPENAIPAIKAHMEKLFESLGFQIKIVFIEGMDLAILQNQCDDCKYKTKNPLPFFNNKIPDCNKDSDNQGTFIVPSGADNKPTSGVVFGWEDMLPFNPSGNSINEIAERT